MDDRSIAAKKTSLPYEVIDLTSHRWVKRSYYGTFLECRRNDSPFEGVNLSQFEPLENDENKQRALKHLKNLQDYNYMRNHPEQRRKAEESKKRNKQYVEKHKQWDLARKNIAAHQNFILA